MHNASFSEHLASWDRLARGVSSRAAVPALMQSQREELIRAREKAWAAHLRRLAAKAAAQQATRDVEAAVAEAHEVATRLRRSVWGKYGMDSPALHVFGMRPYPRTRARRAAVSFDEGESLPNVVPEPAPPPRAVEVKGEPSPAVSEAEDRRGAVPQREPDAQTRSGGLVNDGERLPNVIPEPAPPPPAAEVKGEPSPSVREAEDRRGAVPQREPDAQTRSGGLVNDEERLPNDRRPPTFSLAVLRRAREAEEQGEGSPQRGRMPTDAVGEAAPPGAIHLPAG